MSAHPQTSHSHSPAPLCGFPWTQCAVSIAALYGCAFWYHFLATGWVPRRSSGKDCHERRMNAPCPHLKSKFQIITSDLLVTAGKNWFLWPPLAWIIILIKKSLLYLLEFEVQYDIDGGLDVFDDHIWIEWHNDVSFLPFLLGCRYVILQ